MPQGTCVWVQGCVGAVSRGASDTSVSSSPTTNKQALSARPSPCPCCPSSAPVPQAGTGTRRVSTHCPTRRGDTFGSVCLESQPQEVAALGPQNTLVLV